MINGISACHRFTHSQEIAIVKMPGIDVDFSMLSDFRELSLCFPWRPCFYYMNNKYSKANKLNMHKTRIQVIIQNIVEKDKWKIIFL